MVCLTVGTREASGLDFEPIVQKRWSKSLILWFHIIIGLRREVSKRVEDGWDIPETVMRQV
jgi:hypothetical protein